MRGKSRDKAAAAARRSRSVPAWVLLLKRRIAGMRHRWRLWLLRMQVRLRPVRRSHARPRTPVAGGRPRGVARLAITAFQVLVIVTAPFVVLIRGAVWLYQDYAFPTWLALLFANAATLGLLSAYGALVSRRLTGKARWGFVAQWVAAPLVVGYCGYALLHLSRVNAKDDAVRAVYTATHPLLRVAVTTLILADRDAVITDLARTPDDYRRMGLPLNPRSQHYRQADGWVHAVDLRARGTWRPRLVAWYFGAMGFDTLRHTGTADHLHVSLPSREPR